MGMVEALLAANADVCAVDENGNSALHLACYYGNTDVVQLLLGTEDVDVVVSDRCDRWGWTRVGGTLGLEGEGGGGWFHRCVQRFRGSMFSQPGTRCGDRLGKAATWVRQEMVALDPAPENETVVRGMSGQGR